MMKAAPVELAPSWVQPVLLIGAGGMLARAFSEVFARESITHRALTEADLDIRDAAAVRRALDGPWKTVINCAAWTNVDGAEANEAVANEVNGAAVALLGGVAHKRGAEFVHFSTDYVFNGRGREPYKTDERKDPINAYGRSKSLGEDLLVREGVRALVIRTSWLYAPWGNNFVRTIAKLLREKPSIQVVNDQRGRPTSAEHLARTTLRLLATNARGTFHATDGGECTWFDFAREIGRLSGAPGRVEPCTSAEFPRPAKRPAYSVLDISGTEKRIGPMPDWRANLADVVARIES